MPFSIDIFDDEPYEIRIHKNSLEILATVPIGHNPVNGNLYSAHVALIRLEPYEGTNKAELLFEIVETSGDNKNFFDNGLETQRFLSGADRTTVLEVICAVITSIVAERRPDVIVMTTSQPNLPAKALTKYRKVSQAIRLAGYDGGKGNSFDGQSIWMFVKT
ncbi:hypothetical protein SAMN05421762_1364 [Pseudooceanicola nitratireducens]|jgi:hypothetical protein|uniref:Uncharacterized protein n=1 Tax=Pseudooceanicola nitratireducens TaxID=517719 RepID=A0A1I1K6R1_9RHOB|nr:hypothetical protein [Pseudooceanicola nitratireducens]SEJ48148.1 hypothetical protein SAMN05216183_103429 [Pseudooceanicola nitratireducens]SFC56667.1 hypothetical protein SAMN05421762_1364 [Pseudooceanicola nitratireducens]